MGLHNRKSLEPYIKDEVDFYDHQTDGVRWLWNMKSFLLADDMGLGKTIEALTVFAIHCKKMKEKYNVDCQMLVVCPVSLKVNWAEEIEKFTGFNFVTLDGSPVIREGLLNDYQALDGSKILIVNYEQVKAHLARLNKLGFDVVCADEAHYLKNHKSQRTQAFRSLRTDRSFMLTGSPLLNNVNELWVLLDRIQPKQWGTYWGFTQRFCAFGGWKGKQIIGPKNEAELKEDMGKVMLRRTKDEVLDLPDVQYITRTTELLPQQRKLYDKVVEELLLDTGNGDPDAVDNPMTKFLRLKQICGTTATVRSDGQDHSAKLDLAVEDANEIFDNGHKIVSFTQFRPVQAAYVARIQALSAKHVSDGRGAVPIFILNGDVPAIDRQDVVKAWASITGPAILVCMIQVAGIGLNMTAARHGQFIDKLFVPMLNQQAVDRMHRIGSSKTQSVQIFDYQAKDTIEARVETILRTKKNLFENIVEQKEYEKKLIRTMMQELRK